MKQNNKYKFKDFSLTLLEKKHDLRGYIIMACVFLAIHFMLEVELFSFLDLNYTVLRKISLSLSIISILILVGKIIENIIINRNTSEGDKHNLLSITGLITTVLIITVVIAFMFQNLYALAVSFGLISLVLGFALQSPIASFIAWLYIVIRRPYKVGDRIQLEKLRGDVVEINYLDTAVLECNGDYLQNDRRSGRIIYFPNSIILKSEVINYSGPFTPFIWDETGIQIAYTSDLQFVEECLLEAANADFTLRYAQMDQSEKTEWKPAVYFRTSRYAWLEAVISYPVEPKDTTGKRNRILKSALTSLNESPQKVQFPEGTLR